MPYDDQEPRWVKNLDKERRQAQNPETAAAPTAEAPVINNEPKKTAKEKAADFTSLKTAEEKAEVIDEVLENSQDLIYAFKDIEIEAAGGYGQLKDQVGAFGNIKIRLVETLSGRVKGFAAAFKEVAKVAHKEVDKQLKQIEEIPGKELLEKKENLAKHEKGSLNDLKILEDAGVHSPAALEDIKNKLGVEKTQLAEEKNSAAEDLNSQLSPYREAALEKQKEVGECVEEYQGYYDHVTSEKTAAEKNIAKYEKGLANMQLEGETAEEIKEDFRKAIEEQKEKLVVLEACEKKLKQRLDALKENKKNIDAYFERINNIGMTPEEIKQRKAEERKKQKAKKAAETAAAAVGPQPAAAESVEVKAAAGGTVESGGGGSGEEGEEIDDTSTIEEAALAKKAAPAAAPAKTTKKPVKNPETAATAAAAEASPEQMPAEAGRERKEPRKSAAQWLKIFPEILSLSLDNEQKKKMEKYFSNKEGIYAPAIALDENQAIANMANFLLAEVYPQGTKTNDEVKLHLSDQIEAYKNTKK